MTNDPVAEMLTAIRNKVRANSDPEVKVPASRMKREIARVLTEEGYIKGFSEKDRDLILELKFKKNTDRPLTGLKRISRPGLRVYVNHVDIPKVLGDLGDAIISTSAGIMTGRQARRQGLGGEVLAYVW
jgi:small subunit ribosomal protein S8